MLRLSGAAVAPRAWTIPPLGSHGIDQFAKLIGGVFKSSGCAWVGESICGCVMFVGTMVWLFGTVRASE